MQLGVPRSVRQICHKLAELGWLFRKVRAFIEGKKIETTAGLVVQVRGEGKVLFVGSVTCPSCHE